MTVNRKVSGTASSVPAGIMVGVLVSIGSTVIGALLVAGFINRELLKWENTGYAVMIILVISSWLGAMVTTEKIKSQRLAMCITSGAVYFGLLLIATALFFGGHYSGVGETFLLVLCGALLAVFTGNPEKLKNGKTKIRVRNR